MIVREDDIRRPDGTLGIYGVIDKPTYALVIARDTADARSDQTDAGARSDQTDADAMSDQTNDRYRLVEQFRYPIGLRRWEFPQGTAPGTLEGEQPPPAELAADELREETGLRAESMVVLGQLDVAPGMSSQRGWVFLATGITEGEHERELEEQDMHSEWFTGDRIDEMIIDGTITDAQTIAAWMLLRLANRP